jgi:hypothetical protein
VSAAAKPVDKRRLQGHLPYLNELGFTLARILVTLVALTVAIVSFLSGGTVVAIALRTGVAILAVGLIGWLVNWILVGGGADVPKENAEGPLKEGKPAASTIERSA